MNNPQSPFIQDIRECKQTMRKLRKKIYKHSISTKNKSKKNRDSTEEIITIFRSRNIPEFVADTLKKRRNFDMSSIKNISISTQLPLSQIQNRTKNQEQEISQLYLQHKERMNEIRRSLALMKTQKSINLKINPQGIYSTTEEEELLSDEENYQQSESSMNNMQNNRQINFYDDFSQQQKEPIFTENYLHMNNMQSSLDSDMALFNF